MEVANELIGQYGYFAVFILLSLGIVGLPIPDEALMTLIGYFTHIGTLNYELAIIISFSGTFLGMLISYMIGKKAGKPLLDRFGKWIGMKGNNLIKVESWIRKFGPYSLLIAYFIPGVRHLTFYCCGIAHMKLRKYLLYGGIGAFIWCFVFITMGKVLNLIGV